MLIPQARLRLARIRCLQECIDCFNTRKCLPESLCYVPAELVYHSPHKTSLTLTEEGTKKTRQFSCTPESRLYVSGEELCDSQGKWIKVKKIQASPSSEAEVFDTDMWLLLFSSRSSTEDAPTVVPAPSTPTTTQGSSATDQVKPEKNVSTWQEVVEQQYMLQFPACTKTITEPDRDAVARLQALPPGWTLEHDESLVNFMSQHLPSENDQLGSMKSYVESIDVSSYCDEDGPLNLTDGDADTFWESDGNQGQHWIQLRMKKGTIIKKLSITVDGSDDNYLPSRLVIQGGEQDNLKILNTVTIENTVSDQQDVALLGTMTEHYPIVMIRIKECKTGGIDTRIRSIKLVSTEERSLGFDRDFFGRENLVRFPLLDSYNPDQLYRRSICLQRFITILDSVLQHLVPSWQFSIGSYNSLEIVRQLLPLSKKRLSLIDTFLKASATEPPEKPVVYVNRRAAMEHRCEPHLDTDYKNSVFMQLYEGLKPRERSSDPLDYRWSARHDQWWECKFLSEGIIDQGGGFRDSLSDLAEELCPTSKDGPVSLPFFIRAPNQTQEDASVSCDVYIPNPQCQEFEKYEWLGQIMGACFRGRESLILSLSAFVWKKLVGENVTWVNDFQTVDAAEVKVINTIKTMDEQTFSALERQWSLTLSDGTSVSLKVDSDGNPLSLKYEDRTDYCREVQKIRMAESDQQIQALQRGLLKTIPKAVLDLLPWQELETRVCGDPDITIEALKRATHYDDMEETDIRVKYLWEALKKFTNEDRSRFLRFVTGRRRLPAPLYISSGKGDAIDSLPESSTCANMLYLPYYSNAKLAEEKLRYAAYNCIAIDTDMNPWED
ncbi:E3 ubiquitin-protein ligase HECTD3-like [Haliotis rubra]|uniref:E3 ubiquitin-protein ligase HECTD3-like n=1 Tax=Haliotis rubra TaxID=36100 RepID=UPI001EE60425|nr:E3 ubiquitin-protein ligase HECTD3-like [Haliotis rubra]